MADAVSNTIPFKPKMEMSFGIVAVDKEHMSRTAKIYPEEILPAHTPILEAKEIQNNTKTIDRETTISDSVTTKNYIEADYLDLFSNRVHPPDIRKGEQVILIQFTNSEKYWWFSTGRDDHLRRCERVRLAVSDDTRYQKELNDENTYYFEMDTLHKKQVTISTSRSDNEKHRYMIRIDPKESTIFMCDDDDNEFRINTEDKQVYMRNSDGCLVELDKKNVTIIATEDLILKAGRQIVRDSPVDSQYTTTNTATSTTKARAVGVECTDSHVVNSPSIGLNGQVAIGNNLSVAGIVRCAGIVTGGAGAFAGGNSVRLRSKGDNFLSYPSIDKKKPASMPDPTPVTVKSGGASFRSGGGARLFGRGTKGKDSIPVGDGVFPYISGDLPTQSAAPKLVKVNKYYSDEEKKEECARMCMMYRRMFRKLYMNDIETQNNSNDQDRTCQFGENRCHAENKCKFIDACDKYMDQYTATDDDDSRSHYSSQPDVDLISAEGSGSNTPIDIKGANTVRHAAAWEQVCPSLKMLALDIRRIHEVLVSTAGTPNALDTTLWPEPLSEAVEFLSDMAYMKEIKGD